MIIINTIDVQKFSFNGIPYFKNFTPFSRGGKIKVLNVYDAKLELCEFKNPEEFTVNGVVYANIADLQDALLPVLYTRNSLNSNDDLFAQIIQAGTSVLDEENRTYTFSDWKWKLYGPVFEPAPFTTDEIPEEDEGESRVYHVLGSNTGNYVINPGPSGVIPVDPGPILNTIYLTRFVVSGNVIGSVEAPILGSEYVRKNYSNRHTIFSGVVDGVYPLPADGRTSFVFDIGGFDFEGFYFPEDLFFTDHLYEGKLFYFKNTSGAPVTLKHDGESDVWFNHVGATDLVFESSEEKTLMFKFSFQEGLTLLNSSSGDDEDFLQSNWFFFDFSTALTTFPFNSLAFNSGNVITQSDSVPFSYRYAQNRFTGENWYQRCSTSVNESGYLFRKNSQVQSYEGTTVFMVFRILSDSTKATFGIYNSGNLYPPSNLATNGFFIEIYDNKIVCVTANGTRTVSSEFFINNDDWYYVMIEIEQNTVTDKKVRFKIKNSFNGSTVFEFESNSNIPLNPEISSFFAGNRPQFIAVSLLAIPVANNTYLTQWGYCGYGPKKPNFLKDF